MSRQMTAKAEFLYAARVTNTTILKDGTVVIDTRVLGPYDTTNPARMQYNACVRQKGWDEDSNRLGPTARTLWDGSRNVERKVEFVRTRVEFEEEGVWQ